MRDLERKLHEGSRSEKLEQQIITGESRPGDAQLHTLQVDQVVLGRRGGDGVTPQGLPLVTGGVTPQGYLPATKSTSR